jgi:AP-2 complex subunit alpha
MPPFPPRTSALIGRLDRKQTDTEDKRTWIHGGKDANVNRPPDRKASLVAGGGAAGANESSSGQNEDILSSLAGLNISSTEIPSKPKEDLNIVSGPAVDRWFDKLTYTPEGVLYEDLQIQIGIKSRYQGHMGQLAIYVGNKIDAPLTSFTSTVKSSNPDALSLTFTKIPPSTVAARTQTQQLLQIECKKFFAAPPVLTITFLAGALQTISVRLPVVITRFFEHVQLNQADFFERWKLIGGPPRESQSVFPIQLNSAGGIDTTRHRAGVSGTRLNILDGIDPNPNNLVAAGVLHMSVEGKVGCLVRVEPNQEAKVCIARGCFVCIVH